MTAGWGGSLNATYRAPGDPQARPTRAEVRIRELIHDAQGTIEDLRQVIAEGRAEAAAGFGRRCRRCFGHPLQMAREEPASDLREVCTRALSTIDAVADTRNGPNFGRPGAESNQAFIDELAQPVIRELSRFLFAMSMRYPAEQGEPGRKTPP